MLRTLTLCSVFAATAIAAEPTAKDTVTQLYQAHRSKHDPLAETQQLGRYFGTALLRLYLRDQRESKGEVGRLDGDPLYNAQDIEIKDFTISSPETVGGVTRVTVASRILENRPALSSCFRTCGMVGRSATFFTMTVRR